MSPNNRTRSAVALSTMISSCSRLAAQKLLQLTMSKKAWCTLRLTPTLWTPKGIFNTLNSKSRERESSSPSRWCLTSNRPVQTLGRFGYPSMKWSRNLVVIWPSSSASQVFGSPVSRSMPLTIQWLRSFTQAMCQKMKRKILKGKMTKRCSNRGKETYWKMLTV